MPDQSIIEAMVDMVLDQRAFGLLNSLFNRMKLLCDVPAGLLILDHLDDACEVPIGTFQPLDDGRVGCMSHVFCHIMSLSPKGDQTSGPRPTRAGRMTRRITEYLRGLLTFALTVGMLLSANSRSVSHDFKELAKIVAEHHAEIQEHGHAHEDIVDVMHAYHGHSHEIADHDHNIAFLSPRDPSGSIMPTRKSWAMANSAMPDRRDFGLDRPPRV
jgi:hypothetical protein